MQLHQLHISLLQTSWYISQQGRHWLIECYINLGITSLSNPVGGSNAEDILQNSPVFKSAV